MEHHQHTHPDAQAHNPAGHAGHDHSKMIADFRNRFFRCIGAYYTHSVAV